MVCYTNDKLTKVSHLCFALPLASVLFVILLEISSISASMMTGGMGDLHQCDQTTQDEVNEVKDEFEKQSNLSFSMFEVVSYKTQVVAGINKFVKVKVGNNEYAHLRVFISPPCTNAEPSLAAYQLEKTESDSINYFGN